MNCWTGDCISLGGEMCFEDLGSERPSIGDLLSLVIDYLFDLLVVVLLAILLILVDEFLGCFFIFTIDCIYYLIYSIESGSSLRNVIPYNILSFFEST